LLLTLGAAAARVVDEFARLAEAYQAGAQHTRFPCIDKTDDRNVIGRNWKQSSYRTCAGATAMRHRRKGALLLLGGLRGAAQGQSGALDWPGPKPIRFEVGAAAGGLIDSVPRTLSNSLAASVGGRSWWRTGPAPAVTSPPPSWHARSRDRAHEPESARRVFASGGRAFPQPAEELPRQPRNAISKIARSGVAGSSAI